MANAEALFKRHMGIDATGSEAPPYTPEGVFLPAATGLIIATALLQQLAVQCTSGSLEPVPLPVEGEGKAIWDNDNGIKKLMIPGLLLKSTVALPTPALLSTRYEIATDKLSIAGTNRGNNALLRAAIRSGLTNLVPHWGWYGDIAFQSWGNRPYAIFSSPNQVEDIVQAASSSLSESLPDMPPMNNIWELTYRIGRLTAGAVRATAELFGSGVAEAPSIEMRPMTLYQDGTLVPEAGSPDILQNHALVKTHATFDALSRLK